MTRKPKLPDLETSLAEINTLIEKMEKGELTLEQSLDCFERGITLIKNSQKILQEAEQKVVECIKNFADSPIVKTALSPRAQWISIEELTSFQLAERFKILVVIDFAMKWMGNDGKETLILFDWKTGKASEKTDAQLYSYALFATRVFQTPLSNIVLTPFYLFSNEYKKITNIEQEKLDGVEKEIVESCETMAKKLPSLIPHALDPPPDPREFPHTPDREKCRMCSFQRLCQKSEYRDVTQDELRQLVTG